MPRDGALALSDVRGPTLSIVCERSARALRRGKAPRAARRQLTGLLVTLADCPKARAANIYNRCKVVYWARGSVAMLDGQPQNDVAVAVAGRRSG
jgi:hypothetical protein